MKTILIILFAFTTISCFAQSPDPKNELGINLFGIGGDVDFLEDMKPYFFNGIQYKRAISKKYNIRLSGQYAGRSGIKELYIYGEFGPPFVTIDQAVAKSYDEKRYNTRVGMERTFLEKKIRPFIFADLEYSYVREKGFIYSASGNISSFDNNDQLAGLGVGLGIKYYPTQHIYLSLESNIGFYKELFTGTRTRNNLTLFYPIKMLAFGIRF
jgi:opacity protein-like surface antigen